MHPLHQRIVEINTTRSAEFVAAEGARRRYLAQHRTHLGCVKCMDGRVLIPVMTGTPIGIVRPFRAIGGRFEVFWPSFLGRVHGWVCEAMDDGAHAALLLSYHFSASDTKLGCAGWHHDTAAARKHAELLRDQLGYVFGEELVPIVIGAETDRDIITIHGTLGDLCGEHVIGKDSAWVLSELNRILPSAPARVRADLVPLMLGNAKRIEYLTKNPRNLTQLGHDERILAVGQGFDWLAEENLALIVNDADPNLSSSIKVAANILANNLESSPDDVVTLFSCLPYFDPGIDKRQAEVRARGLLRYAEEVAASCQPELYKQGKFLSLAGLVWQPARRLELLLSVASGYCVSKWSHSSVEIT